MHIDHHLQLAIIERLAASEEPLSYTRLKQPDVENSLFSYHLNKLLDQKLIQKDGQEGYSLTVAGSRWLNDNGMTIKGRSVPRVSVALVVRNESGDYLIGQRLGQFKAKINDYLLPSLYYQDGLYLNEQIERVKAQYIPAGKLLASTEFGFGQISVTYSDGQPMRGLFCITACLTKDFAPPTLAGISQYAWLSPKQIELLDHPSATLLRAIIAYTKSPKNIHPAPIFKGK